MTDVSKKIKVRVLSAEGDHKANDVISLSESAAEIAVKAGWADSDPKAVAYAAKLPQNQKQTEDETAG